MFITNRTSYPLVLLRPDEGTGGGSGTQQQQQQEQTGQREGEQQQTQQRESSERQQQQNQEERVPYDRFAQVNEQLRESQEQIRQLREQQTQREREGLSESDRIRAELADTQRAREDAERRASDAEQARQIADRQAWVRDAARAARFHDPDDAIARIDTSVVRTADSARREVQALADRAAHLIAPEQNQQERSGADLLQRVLQGGERVGEQKQQQGDDRQSVIPADQFNKLTVDQLVSLQERDPALYERSLRAAAAA